jgi:tRNA(ile)-lysidine synthase
MTFLRKLNNFINKNNLLSGNRKLLVAVSGGIDSVVLLDMLVRCGYRCAVAHCNFHLRSNESDNDEQFVRALVQKYDIPLFVRQFDTIQTAKNDNISIEMAARKLRYDWFEELVKNNDFQSVAVAHHKNDNTETVLLNMARGSGLQGLAGIRARRGAVVRPLLCFDREEIELYAKLNNIEHCTDRTNTDTEFQRNRIRHNIIPEFLAINNNFVEQIDRFAAIMREYNDFFDYEIKKHKTDIVNYQPHKTEIDIPLLLEKRFARIILFDIIKDINLPVSILDEIDKLIHSQTGKYITIYNKRIIKNRDKLLIVDEVDNSDEIYNIHPETRHTEQPVEMRLDVLEAKEISTLKCRESTALIDYDRLTFPLTVRHWQHGDRFIPLGMKGYKKLSDFFVDQKIDIAEKRNIFILTDANGQIIWIISHRLDNRFRITENTKRVLRIETVRR